MTFNDVMPIFRSHERVFPEQVRNVTSESRSIESRSIFTMSKIGHFQNRLEEIFDEFTPKFVNKMHWIQLQYHVGKNKRILVVVKVLRKEVEKETLKSAMYVTQIRDLDFLRAYLAGLSLTLAT